MLQHAVPDLAAYLLVNAVGGDGDGVGLVLDPAGLEIEVGSSPSLLGSQAQHLLVRGQPLHHQTGLHTFSHASLCCTITACMTVLTCNVDGDR